MNREETKEAIAIMQAFADGKEIQFLNRGTNEWTTLYSPAWDFAMLRYRIKPEPITCWITVLNDKVPCTVHHTYEDAFNCVRPDRNPEWSVRKVEIS